MALTLDQALMILGIGTSAAGNIGGGLIAGSDGGGGSEDERAIFLDLLADPLLSALSSTAAIGVGAIDPFSILEESSPVERVIAEIMEDPTLNSKIKRRAVQGLRQVQIDGTVPANSDIQKAFMQAIGQTSAVEGGVPDGPFHVSMNGIAQNLFAEETAFQQQVAEFEQNIGGLLPDIRENQANILAQLSETGAAAGGRLDELSGLFSDQIAQEFQNRRDAVLQAANVGGFNPAAALAELGETEQLTSQTQAIDRALQVLQGQQATLVGALDPAAALALNVAGLRNQAQLGAGQIAASQLTALQGLSAQQEANRAGALGSGVAAAGQAPLTALLLERALRQEPGQPAGGQGSSLVSSLLRPSGVATA